MKNGKHPKLHQPKKYCFRFLIFLFLSSKYKYTTDTNTNTNTNMTFGVAPIIANFEKKHFIILLSAFIVLAFLIYIVYSFKYQTNSSKIKIIASEYDALDLQNLESYDTDQCLLKYKDNYLSDFYVASSANSFLVGKQKYDYVNVDMIKNCIIMGARYVELEIMGDSLDINPKPIITTGTEIGQWQTSLNNISFEEACQTIAEFAFNPEVKTYQLPFFLYLKLRINNNPNILSKMTNIIKQYFPSKSEKQLEIGNSFPTNINPAETKICTLFNQIIIWSDPVIISKDADRVQKKFVNEYLDVVNKFAPNRIHYTEIDKYGKDKSTKQKTPEEKRRRADDLTESNRSSLTIVYPNKDDDDNSDSYNPEESWSYGCQFVAINYQLNDDNRRLYFNKFLTDSISLKPSVLCKNKSSSSDGLSNIDNLVKNEKETTDVVRKNLKDLFKNTPIYLRPFNDSSKVLTIEKNGLIVKSKTDSELNITDGFLIQPSLKNPNDTFRIALESIRYPNYYLAFADDGFNIYDWRTRKFDDDVKEFLENATFIIKQGLASTRGGNKTGTEDTSFLISIYIQNDTKDLMIYHQPSNSIISKDDDGQNYETAAQATFNMFKLPVKTSFTIRQTDSQYVHSENKLLIKNKNTLGLNGIFDFDDEKSLGIKNLDVNPLVRNIHIKDNKDNYWVVDEEKSSIRASKKEPGYDTRFYLKQNGRFTQIFYKDRPIIVQSDGVIRLAYDNEINKKETMFIIGNSYQKI
jgi:hypothetical protein